MRHRELVLALVLVPVGFASPGCDEPSGAPAMAASAAPSASPLVRTARPAPSSARTRKPAPKGPSEPLNVLLVTIDSLRADVSWTGYPRETTPNLAKVASKAVVYTNAYAVASYTAKSVAAILAGRYPSTLYRTGWFFTGYARSNVFFPELLQEQGIRTMGGHGHMYFHRGKHLEQGFDVWRITPGITFDPQTDQHVTSDKMTRMAIEMLRDEANTSKQFFLWLHYMDPHDVYVKHPEAPDWGRKNRDRYDSEVFFADLHVGKLLEFCRSQPWWRRTALIVSADHGEAFGEHGMWKHAFEIWDVLTRVPLLVKAPGAAHRVIDARRSQIDLAPTIVELMGHPGLGKGLFVGRSLVREIYGAEEPGNREPIVLDLPEDSHNPPRRAVIRNGWKLIVYGKGWKYLLFDLNADPGEKKDLSKEKPQKLAEMKRIFEDTWKSIPSIRPYGGMKLKSGGKANGPMGPPEAPEPN